MGRQAYHFLHLSAVEVQMKNGTTAVSCEVSVFIFANSATVVEDCLGFGFGPNGVLVDAVPFSEHMINSGIVLEQGKVFGKAITDTGNHLLGWDCDRWHRIQCHAYE